MSDDPFLARARTVRRTKARRIAIAVVGLVATAAVVWVVWFSSVLSVSTVEVDGVTTLKSAQVQKAAAVPSGRPLARLDIARIEARVAKMARIESVDVTRSWPRTVHIEVVERTPVMWMTVDGQIRGVDRSGIAFRSFSKKPRKLLEASVTAIDQDERFDAVASLASVVELLESKGATLRRQVQSVSAASTDSIELNLTDGRAVVWGSTADGARKLRVLKALLGIKAKRYDVSAPDQPTTTP
ncbi:MAG: hypothetical protein JWP31_1846 [Aeromicrobium sp.]|nr:hypothetical protein [Aeromicrobium sp.]